MKALTRNQIHSLIACTEQTVLKKKLTSPRQAWHDSLVLGCQMRSFPTKWSIKPAHSRANKVRLHQKFHAHYDIYYSYLRNCKHGLHGNANFLQIKHVFRFFILNTIGGIYNIKEN